MSDLSFLVDPDFPVTICPTMPAAGVKRPRKAATPKREKAATITCDDLRAVLMARKVRFTTKHTKAELIRLANGEAYFEAAAYTREKAARKARRAAAKAA